MSFTQRHLGPWLAIFLALLSPVLAAGQQDVVFIEREERPLLLNIYTPLGASQPLPVVIYVFGGSYLAGDRNVFGGGGDILGLTRDGFAVVTFDYRYSTEAVFPAQILDVTAAICWVRRHANRYGLDATRMGLLGHSSGGHLAALAAAAADVPAIVDDSCAEGGSAVRAVVDFFGPTDFEFAQQDVSNPQVLHIIEQLFGGPVASQPQQVALASVLNKVDEQDPPLLIVHGDADDIVPYRQSLRLFQAYQAVQHNVRMITVAGGGHGAGGKPPLAFGSPALFTQVRDFLTQHLIAQPGVVSQD